MNYRGNQNPNFTLGTVEFINVKRILMDHRKILQFAKLRGILSSGYRSLSVGLCCTKAVDHNFLPWHSGLKVVVEALTFHMMVFAGGGLGGNWF